MKTVIYYFSATGNTLFIAKELAKQWDNTQLLPMSSVMCEDSISSDCDRVGFLFPVYFFGLPEMVCDFIKRFKQKEDQYCFGIAVHGGVAGNSLNQLDKLCRLAKIELSYAKDIFTAGSWIVLFKPPRAEEFQYTEVMQQQVAEFAADITRRKTDLTAVRSKPIYRLIYQVGFPIFRKRVKGFSVSDKCIGCGRCAKVCPIGNIELEDGTPYWRSSCEHCLACLHWCPCTAIEYGRATKGKNRYTNPNIHAEELFHMSENSSRIKR